ncbi:hypothetical protein D1O30_17965 [Methylocystis hirsuta]|uniref:Uncharacterized protein n=1 Tax=Methylocystis hirsuta TaxID=369798 RepID=A0A3M9XSC8_9HYPH|nr:hypothetical protein D1O30_17965 [Methylocystis hirsuta]
MPVKLAYRFVEAGREGAQARLGSGGEAGGAERLGLTWARTNNVPVIVFDKKRVCFDRSFRKGA